MTSELTRLYCAFITILVNTYIHIISKYSSCLDCRINSSSFYLLQDDGKHHKHSMKTKQYSIMSIARTVLYSSHAQSRARMLNIGKFEPFRWQVVMKIGKKQTRNTHKSFRFACKRFISIMPKATNSHKQVEYLLNLRCVPTSTWLGFFKIHTFSS